MATNNARTIMIKTFAVSRKNFRCGSCQGLNKRFPGYKETCSELGQLPTSKTCGYYTPDYSQLTVQEGMVNPVINLVEAIRNTPANLMQHFAYLMISAERIQRFLDGKYYLLEKVYYKYRGIGDYLSNYCWAYILDANSDGVTLLGKSGEMIIRVDWASAKTSITSEEAFSELREQMVAKRAIYDPELDEHAKRLIRASMRSNVTKDRPEGMVDLETVASSGEVHKELVGQANLADLFAELGSRGTAANVADREAWKARLQRRRENSGGEAGELEERDSFHFDYANPEGVDPQDVGIEPVTAGRSTDDDEGDGN